MSRARLAVPQGGARCTKTHPGSRIMERRCSREQGSRRSNCKMGALSRRDTAWSIPKASLSPRALKTAVRRQVPAKISMEKRAETGRPSTLARRRARNPPGAVSPQEC